MERYYAVANGRRTGIFTDWETCKEQVFKYSGAIHRKFYYECEAEEFLKESWRTDYEYGPVIYTDGSCLNNGYWNAKAGIGVYWWDDYEDNISEPLSPDEPHTNNRAEYRAALKAIQQSVDEGFNKITIRTDSQLLIKSREIWMPNWKRNGWRTARNGRVANRGVLMQLDRLCDVIEVEFDYVAAHKGDYGNGIADWLAKQGALMA